MREATGNARIRIQHHQSCILGDGLSRAAQAMPNAHAQTHAREKIDTSARAQPGEQTRGATAIPKRKLDDFAKGTHTHTHTHMCSRADTHTKYASKQPSTSARWPAHAFMTTMLPCSDASQDLATRHLQSCSVCVCVCVNVPVCVCASAFIGLITTNSVTGTRTAPH